MTIRDEIQLGNVSNPKAGLLTPKKNKIGCWNVRTIFQTGKRAQAVKEMHNYGLAGPTGSNRGKVERGWKKNPNHR